MADPQSITFPVIAGLALREIGVLAQGEPIDGDTQTDCQLRANLMLDSWNAERLMIFQVQRTINDINGNPLALTAGQQTYTVGAGGNFNIPRPARIERMGIISLTNPQQPLELPMDYLTDEQWANIPVKNIQSSLPLMVWDDQGFPLRNLWYWCVPNIQVNTAIYVWTALTQFTSLTTSYELPPAYMEAVVYNLALRLGPSYAPGSAVNPATAAMASQAIQRVKGMNAPILDIYCDPALITQVGGSYNWLTDNAGRPRGGYGIP